MTTGLHTMPTVRALMGGAVDYAGLFPPAALSMPDAVHRYAAHRDGAHAWMLGRFVLPVARVEEFAAAYARMHVAGAPGAAAPATPTVGHPPGPWRLSVIARASDAPTLAAFNARYGARAWIDTVEVPPLPVADVPALGELVQAYTVFAEVAVGADPAPFVAACAAHHVRAKIRTGGVTAGAIPTPEQVARFMVACRDARVPFKATAGLHHAFRAEYALTYEPASARATMFGFVNVILAGAAAAASAPVDEVAGILAAGAGFTIDPLGVLLPSRRHLAAGDVAMARASTVVSFGSCSFDEPVAELHAAGLL